MTKFKSRKLSDAIITCITEGMASRVYASKKKAVENCKTKLAQEIYLLCMGEELLRFVDTIPARIRGAATTRVSKLTVRGLPIDRPSQCGEFSLSMDVPDMRLPVSGNWHGVTFVAYPKTGCHDYVIPIEEENIPQIVAKVEEYLEYRDEDEAVAKEAADYEHKVATALRRIGTTRRLMDEWPEAVTIAREEGYSSYFLVEGDTKQTPDDITALTTKLKEAQDAGV